MNPSGYTFSFQSVISLLNPTAFFSKMSNQTSLFEVGLGKEIGITAASNGALSGVPVNLFSLHNGHAAQIGTAAVSEAGATVETEVLNSMHNHDLSFEQSVKCIVIRTSDTADSVKDLTYHCTFPTNDEAPADLFSSKLHAWDTQFMLPLPTASGSS